MLQSSRVRISNRIHAATVLVALGSVQTLQAAGFALIEQSVPGMGNAYAGAAATADSVDTLYFNPAGMTELSGTRTGAALHLVLPQTRFKNQGSQFSPLVGGGAIVGGDGGDAGGLAGIPHAYLTHQVDDRIWLGLAINVPFGLTTEYKSDWVGRYHAIRSAVQTVNINPSIAFRIDDRLSVAGGLSLMHLEGEFTNAIDFGTLNLIPVAMGGFGGQLGPAGPGQLDGRTAIEGDSWGWGYNLGLLWQIDEATRLGLHYRSEVAHKIKGDVRFTLPNPALAGTFSNTKARADVDLPATVSLSAFHQLTPEWALLADYTWTGWSSIPELRFRFSNALPDGVTTFDWKDTSRISIGARYTPSGSRWQFRSGLAYDESPIRSASSRSPRLPDADRIWLAIGATFQPAPDWSLDIGYAHLIVKDPKIDKSGTEAEDLARGGLRGSYDSRVDILALEARYSF